MATLWPQSLPRELKASMEGLVLRIAVSGQVAQACKASAA